MVSKKRLDYEFNGHRAPNIPRAPRSIRRRGPPKNSVEDSKLCAFELLATVAGKLLQESESSASSNVAEGKVHPGLDGNGKSQLIEDKAVKSDGSCAESAFVPGVSVQDHNKLSRFKGQPPYHTSVHEKSDVLTKVDCDLNLGICEVKNVDGNNATSEVESGQEMHLDDGKNQIGDVSTANTPSVKDPIKECVNTNVLINSETTVQMPFRRDTGSDALLEKHWNNVKLGIRDDDDNSFRCNKSCTNVRPFRRQPCIGHRRIRKMLTSRYRKGAPKFKGCELYNTREGMKLFYQYRKRVYTQERCQRAPIKKRKFFNDTYAVAYDHNMSSDSISNLPEKGTRMDKSSSTVISERASDTSARGYKKAKDAHVKFSIKSFKVPELYIEVPETASVASLKRTVMEAVTAILGSGIRVGVVLQGKKVRDDNRTLQQAGISHNCNLDTLGFTLEPSFTHISPSTSAKKLHSISPRGEDQDLLRAAATPMIDSGISNASVDPPRVTKSDDVDNNEIISSPQTPVNKVINGGDPDSKALVPVSPMNAEALAVVPVNPKPKRNELSQRRTRRPFSVAEVEALVAAVEKLGTGRWRDVKLGAFEHADHRTYVDLKDKWKTLVHTASIAPQQRRGEPVPQELLDRVLSAHTYWSMHQSKQQDKHPVEPIKTVDRPDEIDRA